MKKYLIIVTAFALFSCNNNNTPVKKDVKQYSIQQLYKTKNINGGVFNKDETKILVNNNETGIFNVYEINLADTSMKPLTQSVKNLFLAVIMCRVPINLFTAQTREEMKTIICTCKARDSL